MLKSLLIRLRRKPKVVREHMALGIAGVFTFLVFGFWVFTVPDRFAGSEDAQSTHIFSTLKDEISEEAPDLGGIVDGLKEVVATSSDEVLSESNGPIFTEQTIEVNYSPDELVDDSRPVRIATTTTASSS